MIGAISRTGQKRAVVCVCPAIAEALHLSVDAVTSGSTHWMGSVDGTSMKVCERSAPRANGDIDEELSE